MPMTDATANQLRHLQEAVSGLWEQVEELKDVQKEQNRILRERNDILHRNLETNAEPELSVDGAVVDVGHTKILVQDVDGEPAKLDHVGTDDGYAAYTVPDGNVSLSFLRADVDAYTTEDAFHDLTNTLEQYTDGRPGDGDE